MVIRTMSLLRRWRDLTEADPLLGEVPVCSLAFRWSASLDSDDLVCGMFADSFTRWFSADEAIPVRVRRGEPEINDEGQLMTFGSERLDGGVWMLNPSLSLPGILHAYLTVYGVPDPAPWDRPSILIATALPPLFRGERRSVT
jgi:hypothetical protein